MGRNRKRRRPDDESSEGDNVDAQKRRRREAQRARRARQSAEDEAAEREANARRMAQARSVVSPRTAAMRRDQHSQRMAAARDEETPRTRSARHARDAELTAAAREQETPRTTEARRIQNAAVTAAARNTETPTSRTARLAANATATATTRESETPRTRETRVLANLGRMAAARHAVRSLDLEFPRTESSLQVGSASIQGVEQGQNAACDAPVGPFSIGRASTQHRTSRRDRRATYRCSHNLRHPFVDDHHRHDEDDDDDPEEGFDGNLGGAGGDINNEGDGNNRDGGDDGNLAHAGNDENSGGGGENRDGEDDGGDEDCPEPGEGDENDDDDVENAGNNMTSDILDVLPQIGEGYTCLPTALFHDIELPTEDQYEGILKPQGSFPGSNRCPRSAIMRFHVTSRLLMQYEGGEDCIEETSEEEKLAAVEAFRKRVCALEERRGCAGCGMVTSISVMKRCQLDANSVAHLKVSQVEANRYARLCDLGKSAHHKFEYKSVLYAVAPKLLTTAEDNTISGLFCSPCLNKTNKKHFRFVDIDTGVPWPGLSSTPLSPLNRLAIQRSVLYAKRVKLRTASGGEGSEALKSHIFSVPHEALATTATAFNGVNKEAMRAFVITFYGEGNAFRALQTTGFSVAAVNPGRTYQLLQYLKAAGHPSYRDITIGTQQDLGEELELISRRVNDAAVLDDSSLSRLIEERLENKGDGYSLLAVPQAQHADNAESVAIVATAVESARALGGGNDTVDAGLRSEVARDLDNEYTSSHLIIGGLHSIEMPLGVPDVFSAGVPPQEMRQRWLCDYTGALEKNDTLIYALKDIDNRHAVNRVVSATAKAGGASFKKLQKEIETPGFDNLLAKAKEDPDSPEAKRMLRTILPLIRVTSAKLPWSPGERQAEVYKLYAMCHRFGMPSMFLTISKESSMSPVVVSIGSRRIGDEDTLRGVWDSSTAASRYRAATDAPATCAIEYQRMALSVLTDLAGVTLTGDRKSDVLPGDFPPGIFGRILAAFAVTEDQARGSLHLHALLWTVLGPIFFSRFAHDPTMQQKISDWIDSLVCAKLSFEEHEAREATKIAAAEHGPVNPPPFPEIPTTIEEIKKDGRAVGAQFNDHDHRSRCRKGSIGAKKCAMAVPRAMEESTGFTQVVARPTSEFKDRDVPSHDFPLPGCEGSEEKFVTTRVTPIESPPDSFPSGANPLPPQDHRVLCIHLQRDFQDQALVEFSEIAASCCRCNTNISVLGGGKDAQNATQYLVKYLSKNPAELIESVPLLHTARKMAMRYGSVADDANTPERDAKFLAAKLLNSLGGMQEYSKEVCAAAALGLSSSFSTEETVLLFAHGAAAALRNVKNGRGIADDGNSDSSDDREESDDELTRLADEDDSGDTELLHDGIGNADGSLEEIGGVIDTSSSTVGVNRVLALSRALNSTSEDVDDEVDTMGESVTGDAAGTAGGEQQDYTSGGHVIVIDGPQGPEAKRVLQVHDYYYRGTAFREMCLYEYVSLVKRERKPRTTNESGEVQHILPTNTPRHRMGGGRPRNFCAPFEEGHPLSSTHFQQLRSKTLTPILAGAPRPTAKEWSKRQTRQRFTNYYAALFVPFWNNPINSEDTVIGQRSAEISCRTPNQFAQTMISMSGSFDTIHDVHTPAIMRSRYRLFVNIASSLISNAVSRAASQIFRFRAVPPWDRMDPADVPAAPVGNGGSGPGPEPHNPADLEAAEAVIAGVIAESLGRGSAMIDARKDHLKNLEDTFNKSFPELPMSTAFNSEDVSHEDNPLTGPRALGVPELSEFRLFLELEWHKRHAEQINAPKPQTATPALENAHDEDLLAEDSNDEIQPANRESTGTAGANDSNSIAQADSQVQNLNTQQREIYDEIIAEQLTGKQSLMLITGGPGTGKTFTMSQVVRSLQARGILCFATAYMWSAVYQMDVDCPRLSLHALMHANVNTFNPEKILRDGTWKNFRMVLAFLSGRMFGILDEISTTQPGMITFLDIVLRQCFDKTKPMGGVSLIKLGDFLQIGPTAGTSLAIVAVKHYMNGMALSYPGYALKDSQKVDLYAARLFALFKRKCLLQQERARGDEAHTSLLKRFDLSKQEPPITKQILDSIPILNPELLAEDPAFEDAVFAVQCNMERLLINKLKAFRFARRHGLPVLSWYLPVSVARNEYSESKSKEFFEAGVQELKYYWVPGMPVVFGKRVGHESWSVTNNRTGVAHSLFFSPEQNFSMPHDALGADASGKEILIPQPQCVHVKLSPLKGEDQFSEEVIVPVSAHSDEGKAFSAYYNRTTEKKGRPRPVSVRNHAVEPAFAMTYEKVQGATLQRIVLLLHYLGLPKLGSLTLQKFYVAISRVINGKHFARMSGPIEELMYLTKLRHDPLLRMWNENYDSDGNWKGGPIASPAADALFSQVAPAALSSIDTLTISAARDLCQKLNIMTRNVPLATLRVRLRPLYKDYLDRQNAVVQPEQNT